MLRFRFAVLSFAIALLAAGTPWPVPPEKQDWLPEGVNLAPAGQFHNPDIVAIESGWRAYVMEGGSVNSYASADGVQWAPEPGTRMLGQHHALVAIEGGWRMYYSTANDPDVRSAVSPDGLDFTAEEGVRLAAGGPGEPDELGLIHPCVIALPGGGWRMYYDAVGAPDGPDDLGWNGIRSASSADGLLWTKDEGFRVQPGKKPAKGAFLAWSPFVEHDQGVFKLYFCAQANGAARSGIRLALSWDGLEFKKTWAKPALRPDVSYGKKLADGLGGPLGLPQDPFVVAIDGGKRLYYWLAEEGTFSATIALAD